MQTYQFLRIGLISLEKLFHLLVSKNGGYDYLADIEGVVKNPEINPIFWEDYMQLVTENIFCLILIIQAYLRYFLNDRRIDLLKQILSYYPIQNWKQMLDEVLFISKSKYLNSFYADVTYHHWNRDKWFATLENVYQNWNKPLLKIIKPAVTTHEKGV